MAVFKNFDRNYYIVAINHPKLKEFKYCELTYSGDIYDLLSEELIEDNKILSYLKNQNPENFIFLKENLKDKLERLKSNASCNKPGYIKNDGIYMNFLAYSALKESYSAEPLYLLQRSDIESPKFGVDSVFYVEKTVWIFEFKTSSNKMSESNTANKVKEGVESLFCKGDIKIASLYDCKENVEENNLPSELLDIIDELINKRNCTKDLMNIRDLHFNICLVSPAENFDSDKLKQYISKKYLDCDHCDNKGKECKRFKCPKYSEIHIDNVFHLKLPTDFELSKLYDSLINKMGMVSYEKK